MRIAIISDIHEDIVSLRRVIGKIDKKGYDRLICLGDISGFSVPHYSFQKTRSAHDCLSLLREREAVIVPGNHDYHAAKMLPESSPVFDFPPNWYELDYRQREELGQNAVWLHEENDLDPLYTHEDLAYLNTLPEFYIMKDTGRKLLFSHYVYPNLSGIRRGFYSYAREFSEHFAFMEQRQCEISVTGHVHARGCYTVSPGQFNQHRSRNIQLKAFPICIGIHPVTGDHNRSGFCIFDTERQTLRAERC